MLEISGDFKMEQIITNCDSLYNAGKFENVTHNLNELNLLFRPDFFNKWSASFKPSILKKAILPITKFATSSSEKVANVAKTILLRICSVLSAINPLKFMEILKKEQQKCPKINQNKMYIFFALIIGSICNALQTFDESTKMQYISLLLSLFQNGLDYINLSFFTGNKDELLTENFIIDRTADICDYSISIIAKYSPIRDLEKLISLSFLLEKNDNDDTLIPTEDTPQIPDTEKENNAKKNEMDILLAKKSILSARICNTREELVQNIMTNNTDLDFKTSLQFYSHFTKFLNPHILIESKLGTTLLGKVYFKLQDMSNEDFESSLSIFDIIIDKFGIEERNKAYETKPHNEYKILYDKLKVINENLIDLIKKNKIRFSLFNKILSILYKSARDDKKIIDKKLILPFAKTNGINDEYRLLSLKIMFLFPNDENVLNILAPFLLTFHNFQMNVYSEYLSILKENISYIDNEMLALILNDSTNPLPLQPLSAFSILKFMNTIPKAVFLNQNLNLDIYGLIDKYILIDDKHVQDQLIKLVKRLNLVVKFTNNNLDFFDNKSSSYLILAASSNLYANINMQFLDELLEYRMIRPHNLRGALEMICRFVQPEKHSQYFKTILNLLACELKVLGFNISKLFKDLNIPLSINSNANSNPLTNGISKEALISKNDEFDHPWVLFNDLQQLFVEYDGTDKFESSKFGQLIRKTLEAINTLYQPKYEGEVGILTACTASIFCKLSLDVIENKINKSVTVSGQIIKIIQENSLPMSESVRIGEFAIHCLNAKTSLTFFLPYLREGAEKSREIANFLAQHFTPQMLTKPLPTFLSFIDSKQDFPSGGLDANSVSPLSKWYEYVDLCQQLIEPEQWVILETDEEKIKSLPDHKNGYIERALEILHNIHPKEKSNLQNTNDDLEVFEIDERSLHFRLDKKMLQKDSLYELTMFLWHSSGIKEQIDEDLLDDNEIEDQTHLNEVIGGIEKKFITGKRGLQNMTYEEIEELALSSLDNDASLDLIIGFFNYSSVNHKTIQLNRWLDKINIKQYDDKHILMISLFLENVHCPFHQLPLKISILAQNSLTSFGYPLMTKAMLALAYEQLTGIRWFLVRSIIGIDPDFFKEFPTIAFDFKIRKSKKKKDTSTLTPSDNTTPVENSLEKKKKKRQKFHVDKDCNMSLYEYYVGLAQTVFDPNDNENELNCKRFFNMNNINNLYCYDTGTEFVNQEMSISPPWKLPSNRKWPAKMKTFSHSHIKIGYSTTVKIGDHVFDDIIAKVNNPLLEENDKFTQINKLNIHPEIFYILTNLELDRRQRKIVQDIFLTAILNEQNLPNNQISDEYNNLKYYQSLRKYYTPSLLTITNAEFSYAKSMSTKQFFECAPSFTLKTFRTLLCQFAKPVPQAMILQFNKTQAPVHPACCYESFAQQGIQVWSPIKEKYATSSHSIGNFDSDYSIFKNDSLENSKVGLFDPSILSNLKLVSDECILTFLFLLSLDERNLLLVKEIEIGSIEVIRNDIVKTLLETITNNPESNVYFAFKAMKAIMLLLKNQHISLDELTPFICNRDFLTSNNFLCAAFVFSYLEKIAIKLKRDDIAGFCAMLKSEEADIFDAKDRWKQRFLRESSNPLIIYETFHLDF